MTKVFVLFSVVFDAHVHSSSEGGALHAICVPQVSTNGLLP